MIFLQSVHLLFIVTGQHHSRLLSVLCVLSCSSRVQQFVTYGLQPTRLPCPWGSPGRNIRVGYHALLQGIFLTQGLNPYLWGFLHCRQVLYPLSHLKVKSKSRSVMSNSLQLHGLYSPWNSPGQNTGVGSLSLLQGIFPTQELNWGLLHCKQIHYQLSYQRSPSYSDYLPYSKLLGVFTKYTQFPLFCHEDPAARLSGFKSGSIIY